MTFYQAKSLVPSSIQKKRKSYIKICTRICITTRVYENTWQGGTLSWIGLNSLQVGEGSFHIVFGWQLRCKRCQKDTNEFHQAIVQSKSLESIHNPGTLFFQINDICLGCLRFPFSKLIHFQADNCIARVDFDDGQDGLGWWTCFSYCYQCYQ